MYINTGTDKHILFIIYMYINVLLKEGRKEGDRSSNQITFVSHLKDTNTVLIFYQVSIEGERRAHTVFQDSTFSPNKKRIVVYYTNLTSTHKACATPLHSW